MTKADATYIGTRRAARTHVDQADAELELSGVEFLGGSAAQNLVSEARRQGVELTGATGEVAEMLEVVRDRAENAQ